MVFKEKLVLFIDYISGDGKNLSLEHRLFLSSLKIGFIISVIGTLIGVFFAPNIFPVFVSLVLSTLLGIVYYCVRIKKVIEPFIIPIIIISFISISLIWVFGGGIRGPNMMPAFVILILSLIIVSDNKKRYLINIFMLIFLIVHLIQLLKPEYITNYSNSADLWIDSFFTLIYSIYSVYFIIIFLHKNYKLEKIRAEESELQFKSLFENAADAIFIADKETGIILNANQAASNLLKISIDNIIGLHQSQLHPKNIENFSKDTFKKHKEEISNANNTSIIENLVICADNSLVPVEILASEVQYKGRNALMGTFRNITERKKAEEDIKNKNQELTNINSTKDKFFSIIAHDLKNPLGNFKNITQIMHEDYDSFTVEEKLYYIKMMKESSENIYELLDNLLEWSRSQRGQINFDPQEFDLNYLINSLSSLLKLSAEDKKVELVNKIKSNSMIFADPNLINIIIRNLISNAIKFTPEGGMIEIGAVNIPSEGLEYSEGSIHIYVKDNGVGMKKETIEKLFRIDQSVTTIGTNNEKGTGLGLILCKEFVEKHGGRIWAESEEGKGSTFYFSLPKI